MKEVSCRVLEAVFKAAERKQYPPHLLLTGTPYTLAELRDKRARIDWAEFALIMSTSRRVFSEDDFVAMGDAMLRSPLVRSLAGFARLLFSTGEFYEWVNRGRGGGNMLFSCIDPHYEELGPGRARVELRLPQ